MKKRQIRLAAIMMSAMFVLTGCGLVTPLHEMTDEERDIVVHYAAYVVGKHNIYQKDGMTNADPEQWLEAAEEPIATEESQENVDSSLSNGAGTTSTQAEVSQKKITLFIVTIQNIVIGYLQLVKFYAYHLSKLYMMVL